MFLFLFLNSIQGEKNETRNRTPTTTTKRHISIITGWEVACRGKPNNNNNRNKKEKRDVIYNKRKKKREKVRTHTQSADEQVS